MYGLFKIPLLVFISPRVAEFSEKKCIIRIPLGYRTKNHLGAMYFGALAVGAELSIAAAAVFAIQESKQRIDFIFKDFHVDFLKRADHHTNFVFDDVEGVRQLILDSAGKTERLEKTFTGYAVVPKSGDEPIMKYKLTLSVRNRSKTA